jgi:hypothetical protein
MYRNVQEVSIKEIKKFIGRYVVVDGPKVSTPLTPKPTTGSYPEPA